MTEETVDVNEITIRLGLSEPPEVLEAAATPIRRGHHLALLAGEGSGKAAVVGLAVLETCEVDEEALQALVLVPDAEHAWRIATAVQRIVGPEGFVVSCPSAAPPSDRSGESPDVRATPHVLVGRPSKLLPEIRSGHHSISALRLLVLDGVADLHALEEWTSVEPILETLPKESRKIAISDRVDAAFRELIERQLPRARRWPEELLPAAQPPAEKGTAGEPAEPVRCALVPRSEFGEAFERCVRDADGLGAARVELLFDSAEEAARAGAALAVAGLEVAGPTEPGERPGHAVTVDLPGEGAAAICRVGLPSRFRGLAEAFAGEGPRYAVIEPRHAPQMELYLDRLNRRMAPLRGQLVHDEMEPVRRYRMRLREAAGSTDLMSELLVLEPLFEEMGTVRVAAALSGLLRGRGDGGEEGGPVRPWADVEAASMGTSTGGGRTRRRAEDVPRGVRPAWTRLYFGVGRRDEAGPSDLVGAITGETGIAGAQIGKIEIMGSFSLVDVDSQVADEVLRKLDGVQIRGRTVPVRPDRES